MKPDYITQEFLDAQRETLLMYKGGGYSGCFWEMNYGWFDEKGEFISIHHSGRDGCKNKEEILNKFDEYSQEQFILRENLQEELVPKYSEMDVMAIVKWLINEMYLDYDELHETCEVCGQKKDFEELEHSGYKGDGGIGIINTGFICHTCEEESKQTITLLNEKGEWVHDYTVSDLYYSVVIKPEISELLLKHINGIWESPVAEGQKELCLGLPTRVQWYLPPISRHETRDVEFDYYGEQIKQIQYSEEW